MRIKLISLLAALCLVLSFAGCTISSPAVAATVDGVEIPSGLYLLYQLQAYTNAQGLQSDSTVDVLKDTIEDKTGAEYIHESTITQCKEYVWVERAFDEQKLSFTEEELATMKSTAADTYASNGDWLTANGVGEASFETYYINGQKYQKLLAAWKETDEAAVTTAEAEKYMDENYAHINVLYVPLTDSTTAPLDDASMETVRAAADKMKADLDAGGDFDELAAATLEEVFGVAGREYTEDSLSSYKYDTIISDTSTGYSDADFAANLLAGKVGFAGVTDYGASSLMVYQKMANYADDADFTASYEASVVDEMQSSNYVDSIHADTDGYTVEENASAVSSYSPKKIKNA